MVGHAAGDSVIFWLQTAGQADIQYEVYSKQTPHIIVRSPIVRAQAPYYITKVMVKGIKTAGQHQYRLLLNGQPVPFEYTLQFNMPPAQSTEVDFTIALGSCALVLGKPIDKKTKQLRRPAHNIGKIFQRINEHSPDLMLWLGDNTYLIGKEAQEAESMRARYAFSRSLLNLQPFLAQTHHYAAWDDHDMGSNDCDRTFPLKNQARKVFIDYWANPSYGIEPNAGLTTTFNWGDVAVFMLDARWYRDPKIAPSENKTLLGAAQFQWLITQLKQSNARLKLVICGTQVLNISDKHETYFHYFENERERLLQTIIKEQIGGVFFVTGDMHYTDIACLHPSNFYSLYDLTVSPLTSPGVGLWLAQHNKRLRLPGFYYGRKNFGLLKLNGKGKNRQMLIEIYTRKGKKIRSLAIKLDELMPPNIR